MLGAVTISDWAAVGLFVFAVPPGVVAVYMIRDRSARLEERQHRIQARQADNRRRERQEEVNQMVRSALKVLTGTDNLTEIGETGPNNPSIRDSLAQALEETAQLTSEVALIHHVIELHLAEKHGGEVPDWLMRAISAQQREAQRRTAARQR